jgi:ATP phosphoribosyltransferase regulatory subunit
VQEDFPDVPLHVDLAELRGYRYQTGAVFAAFVPGQGRELARGGRYDATGEVFGRARPATGFSADVTALARLGRGNSGTSLGAVLAPAGGDRKLDEKVKALRVQGRRVICSLPGQAAGAAEQACTEVLARRGGEWVLLPVAQKPHKK